MNIHCYHGNYEKLYSKNYIRNIERVKQVEYMKESDLVLWLKFTYHANSYFKVFWWTLKNILCCIKLSQMLLKVGWFDELRILLKYELTWHIVGPTCCSSRLNILDSTPSLKHKIISRMQSLTRLDPPWIPKMLGTAPAKASHILLPKKPRLPWKSKVIKWIIVNI